jgi:hypothetical protein
LFPNPAKEKITLSLKIKESCYAAITFYNPLGKKTLLQNLKLNEGSNKNEINIKGLAKGIYVIEIRNDNGVFMRRRFVKE